MNEIDEDLILSRHPGTCKITCSWATKSGLLPNVYDELFYYFISGWWNTDEYVQYLCISRIVCLKIMIYIKYYAFLPHPNLLSYSISYSSVLKTIQQKDSTYRKRKSGKKESYTVIRAWINLVKDS